ncbi:hypothetical protein ACFQY0_18015 [Haloferula chungangensis]|uniref:Outer membrane beta-barrel protein n=1 Tax=Haloferula chungangensis TaxID=1048331 RepID=A0ABW2LCL8_9BACT
MKNQSTGNLRFAAITAALGAGLSSAALAGTPEPAPMMTPVAADDSVVSGNLSLDLNSHFISYGFDVWGGGDSFGGDSTFNPALELNFAFTENFTAILGTWWDVNDNAGSPIGGDLQEVDVWAGGSYAFGDLSVTALYQAWMYGGDTEHILDISLAYDCFLSPSVTFHNRLDAGAAAAGGSQDGTVIVPGIEYGFDLGPVSFAVPLNAGFFLDDGFHGFDALGNVTDSGFGYVSIGLNASYAIPCDERFGAWDIHGGVTYYNTQEDVINNPSDSFFTWNVGIGCSF